MRGARRSPTSGQVPVHHIALVQKGHALRDFQSHSQDSGQAGNSIHTRQGALLPHPALVNGLLRPPEKPP